MHILDMEEKLKTWNEIDIQEVRILEGIGKGSFGVVHKGIWKNKVVAVKQVETESEVTALHNEIKQLSRTCHGNIIELYGACTGGSLQMLVMEYADGGSLYQLLHDPPYPPYTLAHGLSWLLQCAKAVAYLHAVTPGPIIHRDLKPPNLLLSKGCQVLKVCDFGTACDLHTVMTDNTGSAAWMAPEVFEAQPYSEKCDVYSWGIILWEVLTRRVPFLELGQAYRIMWAVHTKRRPPLIVGCPKLLETLMKRCWDHEPSKRPGMEEVVETIPLIARLLKGEDEPILWPSPTDTGSSLVSPTTGCSSAGRSTSQDISDLPSSSSSNTFVPPHQHHNHSRQYHHHRQHLEPADHSQPPPSSRSPLPPSFAGPPTCSPPPAFMQDGDTLAAAGHYWEFPENQRIWAADAIAADDEAARAARRLQLMDELANFPQPPSSERGHQVGLQRPPSHAAELFSPNATANIVVAPENLISPCSTLRSEECMEPYRLPPHQYQQYMSPSQTERLNGGFGGGHGTTWNPIGGGHQSSTAPASPQLNPGMLSPRSGAPLTPRRSPLTIHVENQHESPNLEEVSFGAAELHQQQRCTTCSTGTTLSPAVAVGSSEVFCLSPEPAISAAPPKKAVAGVVFRPKRPSLLDPSKSGEEASYLRRRSAEVPGQQHQQQQHPASRAGHRRSNSSGTLTSLCSGESGLPHTPAGVGAGSGGVPQSRIGSAGLPAQQRGQQLKRSDAGSSKGGWGEPPSLNTTPSGWEQLPGVRFPAHPATDTPPSSPLPPPSSLPSPVAASAVSGTSTTQTVEANHHFQQHKYYQHHHHLSPIVCSYPQITSSNDTASSSINNNNSSDACGSDYNDGCTRDGANNPIVTNTITLNELFSATALSDCGQTQQSFAVTASSVEPNSACESTCVEVNSDVSKPLPFVPSPRKPSLQENRDGIITIGAFPCLGFITETLTPSRSFPITCLSPNPSSSSPAPDFPVIVSSNTDFLAGKLTDLLSAEHEAHSDSFAEQRNCNNFRRKDTRASSDVNHLTGKERQTELGHDVPTPLDDQSGSISPYSSLTSSPEEFDLDHHLMPCPNVGTDALSFSRLGAACVDRSNLGYSRYGRSHLHYGPLLTPIKETVSATIDLPVLRKLDSVSEPLKRHSSEYDEAYIKTPITDAMDQLCLPKPLVSPAVASRMSGIEDQLQTFRSSVDDALTSLPYEQTRDPQTISKKKHPMTTKSGKTKKSLGTKCEKRIQSSDAKLTSCSTASSNKRDSMNCPSKSGRLSDPVSADDTETGLILSASCGDDSSPMKPSAPTRLFTDRSARFSNDSTALCSPSDMTLAIPSRQLHSCNPGIVTNSSNVSLAANSFKRANNFTSKMSNYSNVSPASVNLEHASDACNIYPKDSTYTCEPALLSSPVTPNIFSLTDPITDHKTAITTTTTTYVNSEAGQEYHIPASASATLATPSTANTSLRNQTTRPEVGRDKAPPKLHASVSSRVTPFPEVVMARSPRSKIGKKAVLGSGGKVLDTSSSHPCDVVWMDSSGDAGTSHPCGAVWTDSSGAAGSGRALNTTPSSAGEEAKGPATSGGGLQPALLTSKARGQDGSFLPDTTLELEALPDVEWGGEGLDGSNPSSGAVLGSSGTGPGDDELGSFWELLDADTQPIMPIPGCPESQIIFDEHKEMAKKYLVLQHEIYNLCQQKKDMSEMLAKEEDRQHLHQSRYQDKIMQLQHKRDMLRITHGKLRDQLDRINGGDGGGVPAPHHQYHQPHHHHSSSVQSSAPSRGPPQYLPYAAPSAHPLPHQQTSPLQDQYYHHHHHRQYQHAQPPPSLPSPSSSVPPRQSSPLHPPSPASGVPYPALPNASSCSPAPPPYPPPHHTRQSSHHQQQHRHAHISNLSYTTNPPD